VTPKSEEERSRGAGARPNEMGMMGPKDGAESRGGKIGGRGEPESMWSTGRTLNRRRGEK